MTDNLYQKCDTEAAVTYRRIHGNSEQTHVELLQLAEDQWAAVAVDTDPRDYSAVDSELIAFSPTRTGAETHATQWLRDNPKGVAGGGSGGVLATIVNKLLAWGESMNEQTDDSQQSPDNQ